MDIIAKIKEALKTHWYIPKEVVLTSFAISFFGWIYIPQIVSTGISGKTFILAIAVTTIIFIICWQQTLELICRRQKAKV